MGHVLLLGDLLLDDDLVLRPPGGGVPVDDSLPPPSEAAARLHFPWGLSFCLDILLFVGSKFCFKLPRDENHSATTISHFHGVRLDAWTP